MIQTIIYDWDGTLCDSVPDSFEATCTIFRHFQCEPPTFRTYVETFGPPYTTFYWDNGLPKSVTKKEIWDMYHKNANHHDRLLFDDVLRVVGIQKDTGYNIGLVTGQRKSVLEHQLQKHGYKRLFDHILCEAANDKVGFFIESCRHFGSRPAETYSVGDFATDIRDSLKVGLIPIGIVRNGHEVSDILLNAGAHRVIHKLTELV